MIGFCKHHVIELEKYLEKLYTIDCPEEYSNARAKDGKINVFEEIKYLDELEQIYSAIETGNKNGELYGKYSGYLSNVRDAKVIMNSELKRIKESNADEIKNAELMLKSFRQYITLNQ